MLPPHQSPPQMQSSALMWELLQSAVLVVSFSSISHLKPQDEAINYQSEVSHQLTSAQNSAIGNSSPHINRNRRCKVRHQCWNNSNQ